MIKNIAVVGAGLIGRVMALKLAHAGHTITVFDKDTMDGHHSCAHVAGGLLTPYTELDSADPIIYQLALESITGWQKICQLLPIPVFMQHNGCIVVAHTPDRPDLHHLHEKITSQLTSAKSIEIENDKAPQVLNANELKHLEPELLFPMALYFPGEGQIDNRQLMHALKQALIDHPAIDWLPNCNVTQVLPYTVCLQDNDPQHFDFVIDCRGLGAKKDLNLRGVRGEIIRVYAPEVTLNRPIRLMHPRYVIYIIPRENNHFVIGATSIESEDNREVTVQSALELLSAAFSVHHGFAEAEIIELSHNCRPATSDNLPQIHYQPGLLQINGLYRWGFMLTPALSRIALALLEQAGQFEGNYSAIVKINPMALTV